MATYMFEKGREGIADGTIDLDTNTIKIALLDLDGATDTGVKAITGATNATPIVITSTSHGFSNGDVIVVGGVGGNTAANNIWKASSVATNTVTLVSYKDGTTNSVGNGSYTSGGYMVNLGPGTSGDNLDDFDGCNVGTAQTLSSVTVTSGVFDAADPSFSGTTGNTVEGWVIYKDTGTASTSRMFLFNDGKHIVTCNTTAASSATSIAVEPLQAAIANGSTLIFSNGASATLSSGANAGDRSLAVSSLAAQITAGSYASAPVTSSGLPTGTLSSTTVNVTFDNGTNKICRI